MLKVATVFTEVWNMVVVLSDEVVEAVFLFEDIFTDPQITVGLEQFTIKIVGNSSTVLHITSHVDQGFE